ncbi:MAG: high-potential iron-sulfur protein [Segetibacter sp.]|nr:high-potential iron-sulfur protein [Segetibacter sp.]
MNSSRRRFIHKYFFLSSSLLGVSVMLKGCDQKKPTNTKEDKTAAAVDPCKDFSGVSENDLKARQKLAYVNESPIPDMTCSLCNLWLPPQSDKKCGGCMLFKGPVYATGYCTYWTPKQG